MNLPYRPSGHVWATVAAAVLAVGVTACAPAENNAGSASDTTAAQPSEESTGPSLPGSTTTTTDACAVDQLNLVTPGTLTIATSKPAFDPWFSGNDPTNGKGFESAVAYAVADRLGFSDQQVSWVEEPFNKSYAPGPKDFDFDINQVSITPARAQVVDFSDGYYQAAQAVIVLKDSSFAGATSLADLKGARIGAQIGTTSLLGAQDVIQPTQQVAVFDDTSAASQALKNGQIDALVVDLPSAFYITAVQVSGSTIVGQFQSTSGSPEEFGMLFEKGNPLVDCVDKAVSTLDRDGTLQKLEKTWLAQSADVPELS